MTQQLIHSLTALKRIIPGFNEIEHRAEDFWRIAGKENIFVDFWRLKPHVKGFYGINRRQKKPVRYIIINQRLIPRERWLRTAFHELVHHFLDAPISNAQVYYSLSHATKREEKRADMFGLMMKIPKPLILELINTPFDQITGNRISELHQRKRILEKIGE